MIDRPGQLDPVLRELSTRVNRTRVVEQHVNARIALQRFGGEAADRRLGGQVRDQNVDLATYLAGSHVGPLSAPGHDRQLSAPVAELLGRREPDPVGGARDKDPPPCDPLPGGHVIEYKFTVQSCAALSKAASGHFSLRCAVTRSSALQITIRPVR